MASNLILVFVKEFCKNYMKSWAKYTVIPVVLAIFPPTLRKEACRTVLTSMVAIFPPSIVLVRILQAGGCHPCDVLEGN
jgi:hypothetical protein